MSAAKIDKMAKKIRPIFERMLFELYKKKPENIVILNSK